MVADVSDLVWESNCGKLIRGVKSVRYNDYEKSNSIVGAVL